MEADNRQVTTVFTVQPSFHCRYLTKWVSWSITIVGEWWGEVWLHVCRDGDALWYSVCRVPMVEWQLDCENCRHLTVVGLHDTGPRCALTLPPCQTSWLKDTSGLRRIWAHTLLKGGWKGGRVQEGKQIVFEKEGREKGWRYLVISIHSWDNAHIMLNLLTEGASLAWRKTGSVLLGRESGRKEERNGGNKGGREGRRGLKIMFGQHKTVRKLLAVFGQLKEGHLWL